MESCFNLFGDSVSFRCKIILLGEEAQVEGRFDLFGDSANLDAR